MLGNNYPRAIAFKKGGTYGARLNKDINYYKHGTPLELMLFQTPAEFSVYRLR